MRDRYNENLSANKKEEEVMSVAKHQLRVTLCRRCGRTNVIRNSSTSDNQGVGMSISRRTVEAWYVYTTLKRFVDGDIEVVDNHDKPLLASSIEMSSSTRTPTFTN